MTKKKWIFCTQKICFFAKEITVIILKEFDVLGENEIDKISRERLSCIYVKYFIVFAEKQ